MANENNLSFQIKKDSAFLKNNLIKIKNSFKIKSFDKLISKFENLCQKKLNSPTDDESLNFLIYDELNNFKCEFLECLLVNFIEALDEDFLVRNSLDKLNSTLNYFKNKSKKIFVISNEENGKYNSESQTLVEELNDTSDIILLSDESNQSISSINNNEDNLKNDLNSFYFDSSSNPKYTKSDYWFSENLLSTFHNVFGLKNFNKNQLECINCACLKEDCFVLMPTGGGKSLCYQLPAAITNGLTIVISPLKSLIQDQILKLKNIGLESETLCADIREISEKSIYDDLKRDNPNLKLLYVTPEKINQSKKLIKALENLYSKDLINRFVIDEAHCVSNWGHDFRPDFNKLSFLKEKFSKVPIMALTATATPRVGLDILHQLKLNKPVCFIQSFLRENLKLEVREKTKTILEDILSLINSKFSKKSGIIYCLSRYESEQVSEILCKNGIRARPYHAGLTDKLRYKIQEDWTSNKFFVICATIAFGMGIDKPDVRFIIHYSSPKSIEGYYQEAGRAGRDGLASYCYLFYTYKDTKRLFKLFEENRDEEAWKVHINSINQVAYYCKNNLECRKMQILRYFDEKFNEEECKNHIVSCDNCQRNVKYEIIDFSGKAKLIVESINVVYKNQNKKFPVSHYMDIYKGSMNAKIKTENHHDLPMHGKGKNVSKDEMERFFRKLIFEEFISENAYVIQYDVVVAYLGPSSKGIKLLNNTLKFYMPMPIEIEKPSLSSKTSSSSKKTDKKNKNFQFNEYCFQALLEAYNQYLVGDESIEATIIPLDSLKEMATYLPMSQKEFLKISKVTKSWYDRYGLEFLKVIQNFVNLQKETEKNNETLLLKNDNDSSSSVINIDDEENKNKVKKQKIC